MITMHLHLSLQPINLLHIRYTKLEIALNQTALRNQDIPCPPNKVKVFEIRDREIVIIYQGREEI